MDKDCNICTNDEYGVTTEGPCSGFKIDCYKCKHFLTGACIICRGFEFYEEGE